VKVRIAGLEGAVALWAVFSHALWAAPPAIAPLEGKRIVSIEFSDTQTLDPADLAKAQPLKVNDVLGVEDVARAIDGLFATGCFEDVAVEAELSGNGVAIRFVTVPALFISGIAVRSKSADPPNEGEMVGAAELSLGAPFRESDVTHATDAISQLLQANGLYGADVRPRVERDSTAPQVFISFEVRGGKRAKYETPEINGTAVLSLDTILRVTGWRVPMVHWWRHVTDARTGKGAQNLRSKYAKQDRLTASVELKKIDYDAPVNRVRPTLAVEPGPKVKVTTAGNKVSKRLLKRYVPVFQESSVDNDLLVEGQRNLRDYLQSKGYYDANVDFRVLPPQNDLETVEYAITRGSRFELARLTIVGNHYFDVDTIRERMFMQPKGFLLNRGRYSEAFRRKDEENIAGLYRNNGFRDAMVTTSVVRNYAGRPDHLAVTVRIEEGSQWLVDQFHLQGVHSSRIRELSSQLATNTGEPFSEASIAADRDRVLTFYNSQGFPKATFNATWKPSSTPRRVDVTYAITEGDPQFVRQVLTSGLQTTRRTLVDKFITLHAGDPLSQMKQIDIQKDFYDLGVFARVDTAIENPDGDTTHKFVLYNFDEANRYTFTFGVGAQVARFGTPSTTSLSGPAGTTGFSPEGSVTASRLNFLGLGHTITAGILYSSIEKRASLSYLQPRFRDVNGRNLTYTLLYDDTLDVRTFAAKREEASVQLSQKFSKTLTGLFQIAYRRVSVGGVEIPVLLIPQFVQPVRIGMLSTNFVHDRRDSPTDPHHGIFDTANLGVSTKYFGSQRSFFRALLRNATYYQISKKLVLARQTQFGVIVPFSAPPGVSDQESVPLPERFFGGGADSLRAFAYNEAGPRDIGAPLVPGGPASQPTGFPLGGNALFFNNIELRFPLLGANLQGVVFHDMGNIYSSFDKISLRFNQRDPQDFDYAVHAVGFGIRYKTPLGPLRGDLAYSLNPPSFVGFNGTPAQLLQCNPNLPPSALPSFCQPAPQSTGHIQFFFSIGQTF
jgi:outer membrane protein insertion porin family